MTFGQIHLRLRPLRFAFIVDPSDRDGLRSAIELNSVLWGGMFNPIIPAYQRLPSYWEEMRDKRETARTVISGYLDAFDPDIVIPVGQCADRNINVGNRQLIAPDHILKEFDADWGPSIGIGLAEVLSYFKHKELRFQRREPIPIIKPIFDARYQLFLSSVFGSLPLHVGQIVFSDVLKGVDLEDCPCTLDNYTQILQPENLFVRRLGCLYLQQRVSGPALFYMDATKPLDIMDYWNLRAAGRYVIPIPRQGALENDRKEFCKEFIESNYQPYRHNPNIFHHTGIIKSRSVSEDDALEYGRSLAVGKNEEKGEPKWSFQRWYPRFWNEWARHRANESVEFCFSDEKELQIMEGQKEVRGKTLDPKFEIFRVSGSNPRFANELETRIYGSPDLLAEVIPQGGDKLSRAVGRYGVGDWRLASSGPVYLSRHANWSLYVDIPMAENVVTAWFDEKGWDIELSSSGKVARQMLIRLGGMRGINLLQHDGIIKLLEDLGNDKWMTDMEFRGRFHQIANADDIYLNTDDFLRRYTDSGIFRLGIEVQCPVCSQRSWYSLKEVDYQLCCHSCLSEYSIPSQTDGSRRWAYKAYGPFSLPKQAYGSYGVLLALSFLSGRGDASISPMLSFIGKKGETEIEADLCLFYEKESVRSFGSELIFAECKTYNKFKRQDIQRMRTLASEFPGAVLVFSTLRPVLSETEKRLLRPLANQGRRYWKAEQQFNPVVILTGTELFSTFGAPQCWKDKGDKFAEIYERHSYLSSLGELADATQQLYLDMNPWHEWLEDRWKQSRARMKTGE